MRLVDADALLANRQILRGEDVIGIRDYVTVVEIENAPTIEPEDKCSECDAWNQYKNYPRELKWIPCSERLPEQYGNYLISIDGDEPDIGTINPNDLRGWSLCDANGFYWASDKALNITAWMPLPEPYKGEQPCN